MKKAIGYLSILVLSLLVISGCSAKLSDEKQSFEADGIEYQFQLPSTWEVTKDYKATYNKSAVFGAKDKKSNSSLFVLASRKENVDLDNFGERTRKELAKLYNYKAKDIYMKESKVGQYKAYKFTLNTTFDKRSMWLHLYYIETEHGLVQFDFYSADDGKYEKRVDIIDSSAYSVKEKEDQGPVEEEDDIAFDSSELNVKVTGVMSLAGENDTSVYAIRYMVTNKGKQEEITPKKWQELIQVMQDDQVLQEGTVKKDDQVVDITKLLNQQNQKIPAGKTLESVAVYTLKDKTKDLVLTPSKEVFKEAEPVHLTLETDSGKDGEK
ncbi:hypothetical protein UAY_02171 [Enterococcus moraviensis ATCC BAA-383]|uniref:DUF5067 domain-containing protein n=1 Tax=Enterococcus moraviensis ATCC BAA-383 TaxID=1158609 RepID=R2QQU3_9ENTE|nr:DUF5067 domain-containing protein [Enterococcus moraviensis]EOH98902.1 hypothetical protein UAY_02171 [Enterococcus moraviensis ATCC BAA-383]EOT71923.1 hypothetical protein I586_01730 [Enterococcus moraviensis ATCC BAA-383]